MVFILPAKNELSVSIKKRLSSVYHPFYSKYTYKLNDKIHFKANLTIVSASN